MATASVKELKKSISLENEDSDIDPCTKTPGCSTDDDSAPRQYTDIDLSYLELDTIPAHYCSIPTKGGYHPSWVRSFSLHHNALAQLPPSIALFTNLTALDVSNNQLFDFPPTISHLSELRVLVAKNNQLETYSLQKTFNQLPNL